MDNRILDTVKVDCTHITFIFSVSKSGESGENFTVFKNHQKMSPMNFHAKIKLHSVCHGF